MLWRIPSDELWCHSFVKSVYPWGCFNAHWFSLFNAVSFQVMMGAPIIVYAKSLGASSTVLGIIAAFTPLMTVFQLPAAQHLEYCGYRQFVLMGWGARTILIFVVSAIPLAGFLATHRSSPRCSHCSSSSICYAESLRQP